MKKFIAWARVSSDEQRKQGYSLEVQEKTLRDFARKQGGEIVKLWCLSETASKVEARTVFNELIEYARKNAGLLDGILFDRVDRAARNIFDLAKLEELRDRQNLKMFFVSQNIDGSTPEGELMLTIMGGTARFQVRQQVQKIKASLLQRVRAGHFIGRAPYGYRNVKLNSRSLIETEPKIAVRIKRIFELFAFHNFTLDSLSTQLRQEGIVYSDKRVSFPRSELHKILKSRAYIGDVTHKGESFPGQHEKIIDMETFRLVQQKLKRHLYQNHEMTYAGEMVRCGHCNHPITGETKIKKTKQGPKEYVYYRCSRYNKGEHPRIRVTEPELDKQMLEIFASIRLQDDEVRSWFADILKAKTKQTQQQNAALLEDLQRQQKRLVYQENELVNMRLDGQISPDLFTKKQTELRDRAAEIRERLAACERAQADENDLAVKAFELSQSFGNKWLTASFAEKRAILEIVCLNLRLEGATLCARMRKPFDLCTEGLLLQKDTDTWI